MRTLLALCTAIVWILVGFTAHAEDSPDGYQVDGAYKLPDGVVVTGDPQPRKAFEARRDVSAITRKALRETHSRDLAEALEWTPGVFMQRTNRGAGAPLLRGFIGPQNLIVVDGLRFNLSTFRTGPNQYVALFDPHALERIEVLRGPSSVLYGNGAMGGVVQLLTESLDLPGGHLHVDPRASVGFSSSDAGITAALSGRLSVRRFGLNLGVSVERAGTLRAGGGEDVPVSAYRRIFWRAKAGYEAREWSLTAAYFGGVVGPGGRADNLGRGEVRFYDNLDHFAYLRLDWRPRDSAIEHFRVAVGYHGLAETVERFNCETRDVGGNAVVANLDGCAARASSEVIKTRLNEDRVHAVNADTSLGLRLWDGRLRLTWGGDIAWDVVADSTRTDARVDDDFAPQVRDRGNLSEGSTYITAGAFISATATPLLLSRGKYRLEISGGARVSYFEAHAADVPGLGGVGYEHLGIVASGGVQFVAADTVNIYANVVQGFRAPNLQETTVLGDTGTFFEVPNSALGPERSDTFEVGVRIDLAPVRLSVSFFHSWLSDVIERTASSYEGSSQVDGKEVRQRTNASSGVQLGVEGEVTVALPDGFSVSAAATWVQGDITNAVGTAPARRMPPVFGSARLRYDHSGLGGYAEVFTRWAAPQDRLNPNDLKDHRICETAPSSGVLSTDCDGSPGWATVGLRAGLRPIQKLRIDLQVSNATDSSYRVHGSGFDAAGIDVRLTLNLGL